MASSRGIRRDGNCFICKCEVVAERRGGLDVRAVVFRLMFCLATTLQS